MERVNQSLAEYEKEEKKKNNTTISKASSLCEEIKGGPAGLEMVLWGFLCFD